MYATHSAKQDPMTQAFAIRTVFPEDGDKAWLYVDLAKKVHYVSSASVAGWTDMVPAS